MNIIKLKPAIKDYIWGGTRLIKEYGIDNDDICAEAWMLSCHKDGLSMLENSDISLKEYIDKAGIDILGSNYKKYEQFPILIKLIDANLDLSIQVHPDDKYALENENQLGKTEMWYILDADKDSYIYYGFNQKLNKEDIKKHILNNTILDVLNKVKVKKGDTFFISPGTIHALGKGILIAEIQQSSNITYRVYDYNRKDKDGNLRKLDIDKAIEVINSELVEYNNNSNHLMECEYFIVDKVDILDEYIGYVDDKSFLSILVLEGNGKIINNEQVVEFKKGDSLFISANSKEYKIIGNCLVLNTRI